MLVSPLRVALVLFACLFSFACQSSGPEGVNYDSYFSPRGNLFRVQTLTNGPDGDQRSLWSVDSKGGLDKMVVDWGHYRKIKLTTEGHYFAKFNIGGWWSIADGKPSQEMEDWESLRVRKDSISNKVAWHVKYSSRPELSLIDENGKAVLTIPAATVKQFDNVLLTSVDDVVWQVRDYQLNIKLADAEPLSKGRFIGRNAGGWQLWDQKDGFSNLSSNASVERLLVDGSTGGWLIHRASGEPGTIWDKTLTEVLFESVNSAKLIQLEDPRFPAGHASFMHVVLHDNHFELLAQPPFGEGDVYFRGVRSIESEQEARALILGELDRREAGTWARNRFKREQKGLQLPDWLTPLEFGETVPSLVQYEAPQFSAKGPDGISIYHTSPPGNNIRYRFAAGPFEAVTAVKCETDEGQRLVAWQIQDLPGNPTRLVGCDLENTLSNEASKYTNVKYRGKAPRTTIEFNGSDGAFLMDFRGTLGTRGQYESFEWADNAYGTGFGYWICHRKDGQSELLGAIGSMPELTSRTIEYTEVTTPRDKQTIRIVMFELPDGSWGAKVGISDLGTQEPMILAATKSDLLAGIPAAYTVYLTEIKRRNKGYDAAIASAKAEEEAIRLANRWCRDCAGIGYRVRGRQEYYAGFSRGMVSRYLVSGQYASKGWRRTPQVFIPHDCSTCLGKGKRKDPPTWVAVTVRSDGTIITHD
ncbi:MAG: hypothetical protein JKY61_05490 [Planctomycetes bacterium]|nr:hypothetical protein [Planctomycetota bacterium]